MFDLSTIIDYLDDHIDTLPSSKNPSDPIEKAFIETIQSIKYRWDYVDGGHKTNVLVLISQTKDKESLQTLRMYLKDCEWNISFIYGIDNIYL